MRVRIDGLMVLSGLVLAGGVFLYMKRDELKGALDKVNPASDQKFAYQSVNAIVDSVLEGTESEGDTLGTALYGATHDRPSGDYDEYRKEGLWLQGRVTGGDWEYIKMIGV